MNSNTMSSAPPPEEEEKHTFLSIDTPQNPFIKEDLPDQQLMIKPV